MLVYLRQLINFASPALNPDICHSSKPSFFLPVSAEIVVGKENDQIAEDFKKSNVTILLSTNFIIKIQICC